MLTSGAVLGVIDRPRRFPASVGCKLNVVVEPLSEEMQPLVRGHVSRPQITPTGLLRLMVVKCTCWSAQAFHLKLLAFSLHMLIIKPLKTIKLSSCWPPTFPPPHLHQVPSFYHMFPPLSSGGNLSSTTKIITFVLFLNKPLIVHGHASIIWSKNYPRCNILGLSLSLF